MLPNDRPFQTVPPEAPIRHQRIKHTAAHKNSRTKLILKGTASQASDFRFCLFQSQPVDVCGIRRGELQHKSREGLQSRVQNQTEIRSIDDPVSGNFPVRYTEYDTPRRLMVVWCRHTNMATLTGIADRPMRLTCKTRNKRDI
jgi:hypothetical protein